MNDKKIKLIKNKANDCHLSWICSYAVSNCCFFGLDKAADPKYAKLPKAIPTETAGNIPPKGCHRSVPPKTPPEKQIPHHLTLS
jgi:hypothetical protein